MQERDEGPALPPLPVRGAPLPEAAPRGARFLRDEPRCEMCGAEVVASHCKRICLKCGFMTGCSEGI